MNLRQKLAIKQIANALVATTEIVEEILESNEGTAEDKGDAIIAEYDKVVNVIDAQVDDVNQERIIASLNMMQSGKACMIEILQYVLKGTDLEEAIKPIKCDCKKESMSVGIKEIFEDMPKELKDLMESIFNSKAR